MRNLILGLMRGRVSWVIRASEPVKGKPEAARGAEGTEHRTGEDLA